MAHVSYKMVRNVFVQVTATDFREIAFLSYKSKQRNPKCFKNMRHHVTLALINICIRSYVMLLTGN